LYAFWFCIWYKIESGEEEKITKQDLKSAMRFAQWTQRYGVECRIRRRQGAQKRAIEIQE